MDQSQLLLGSGPAPYIGVLGLVGIASIVLGIMRCNRIRRLKGEAAFQKALIPFFAYASLIMALIGASFFFLHLRTENAQKEWVSSLGYSIPSTQDLAFPARLPTVPMKYGVVAHAEKDGSTVAIQLVWDGKNFVLEELKSVNG